MKKSTPFFIVLLSIFALLTLYSPATAEVAPQRIRISQWHLPLNLPVIAAETWKSYEKAFPKSNVETLSLASGPKQLEAMAAKELDIAQGIGAAAVLTSAANGLDVQIIGVNSRSPKAFAVVTLNPKIKNISDLRGKKVAGLRASVVHQVFSIALAEAGMTEKEVEFFPMPIAQAATTLLTGKVDAALLVGYEIRRALKAGGRILADGQGRVEGLSLIVARRDFIQKYPSTIRQFLKVREEIIARIDKNPAEIQSIAAKKLSLSLPDLKEMLSWYDFSTKLTDKDKISLKKTEDYLLKQRLIRSPIERSRLLY